MKIRTGITGNITGDITGNVTGNTRTSDPLRPNNAQRNTLRASSRQQRGLALWRIQDLVPLGGGGHLVLTELGLDLLDRWSSAAFISDSVSQRLSGKPGCSALVLNMPSTR